VRFLCDTSVLFAASDTAHERHEPSLALVATATPSTAFVAAHSLAELYGTLTAAPSPKVRRVMDVLEAVEHVAGAFTPVSLDVEEYLAVIRTVAASEARSGQVYDALILKCAEQAEVDTVYTWDIGHFQRIAWPEMQDRIRTP